MKIFKKILVFASVATAFTTIFFHNLEEKVDLAGTTIHFIENGDPIELGDQP